MKSWSNSTRAGHAAIPDSRRPDIRIGRVRGIVQDHDPGPAGVVATEHVELLRTQAPSILRLRWQPPHLPPNDLRLGCVGHPCRRGDDDIPVVDELHQEHELLGSWPDEHVVGRRRDPERTAVMLRHRLAELMQSLDRKVGLLKRVASQFLDHGRGNWKGRLSQPHLEDAPALAPELVGELVDGNGRRRRETPYPQVKLDIGTLRASPRIRTRSTWRHHFGNISSTARARARSRLAGFRTYPPRCARCGDPGRTVLRRSPS